MDNRDSLRWRWVGLLVVMVLFSVLSGQGWAQGTVVTLSPLSAQVEEGDTVTVDIVVENVTDLYGAQVQLEYDPTLVTVLDANENMAGVQVEPGTFLSPDFIAQNEVDLTAGRISYAVSQQAPHDAVDGSGTLATITFQGEQIGVSALVFVQVILSAPGGVEIQTSTQDGSITVPAPTSTPTSTPTETPEGSPIDTPTPEPTDTPTETPVATDTPTPTSMPDSEILGQHTVKNGETLFCIGRAYGVDPFAIAEVNGILNPSLIHPGQVLDVPNVPRRLPAGRVCPAQFEVDTSPPSCRFLHTIQFGENLFRISLKYGVSMWSVAEANNIFNLHFIRAGEVLCIP